jgi:hypothetical protein
MFLSFFHASGLICLEVALDYVPRECLEKSRVVCSTLLLGLQVYADSLEIGQQGEMACHFSQGTYWDLVQPGEHK